MFHPKPLKVLLTNKKTCMERTINLQQRRLEGFTRSQLATEVFLYKDRESDGMGDIHHGIPDTYTTHLSFEDRGQTTISTCTLDFLIKEIFKLKRR